MNSRKIVIFSIISLGIISIFTSGKRIPSFAGPYIVVTRHLGNETDEFKSTGKIWFRAYFTSPRPKQLQYIRGRAFINASITDNMRVEVRMSVRSNNQWKKNAFVARLDKACSSLLIYARYFIDLLLEPNERTCPLPKIGFREIKNQTYAPVNPRFPLIMPYGRYLFTMAYIDGDEVVGVSVSDLSLTPQL